MFFFLQQGASVVLSVGGWHLEGEVHQGNLEGQAPLHKALFASNFFLYITWVKMQSACKEHTFFGLWVWNAGQHLAIFSLAILVEDFGPLGNQKTQLDSLLDQNSSLLRTTGHTTIDIWLITHWVHLFRNWSQKWFERPAWLKKASNLRNLQIP